MENKADRCSQPEWKSGLGCTCDHWDAVTCTGPRRTFQSATGPRRCLCPCHIIALDDGSEDCADCGITEDCETCGARELVERVAELEQGIRTAIGQLEEWSGYTGLETLRELVGIRTGGGG